MSQDSTQIEGTLTETIVEDTEAPTAPKPQSKVDVMQKIAADRDLSGLDMSGMALE